MSEVIINFDLKKYKNLILIVLAGLFLRIIKLFDYGIHFYDEAIYVLFGKITSLTPIAYSLDQPILYYYLNSIILNLFNDITMTRILPIIFSLIGIILIYFLTLKLTNNNKTAIISSLLLSLSPIFLKYSKIGLQDTLILLILMASFYLILKPTKKKLIITSILMGLCFNLKYTPILFNIILIYYLHSTKKLNKKNILYLLLPQLAIILLSITPLIIMQIKNPTSEFAILNFPSEYASKNGIETNLLLLPSGIISYLLDIINSITIIGIGILLFSYKKLKKFKQTRLFLIWILLFIILFSINTKVSDRYLLLQVGAIIPLIILTSVGINEIKNEEFKKVIIYSIIFLFIISDLSLIYNPDPDLLLLKKQGLEQVSNYIRSNIGIGKIMLSNEPFSIMTHSFIGTNYLSNQTITCPLTIYDYLIIVNNSNYNLINENYNIENNSFFTLEKEIIYYEDTYYIYKVNSLEECNNYELQDPFGKILLYSDLS